MNGGNDGGRRLAQAVQAAAKILRAYLSGNLIGAAFEAVKHFCPQIFTVIALIVFLPFFLFLSLPAYLLSFSTLPYADQQSTDQKAGYVEEYCAQYDDLLDEALNDLKEEIEDDENADEIHMQYENTRMDSTWASAIYCALYENDLSHMSEDNYKRFLRKTFSYQIKKTESSSGGGMIVPLENDFVLEGGSSGHTEVTIMISYYTPEQLMENLRFPDQQRMWAELMHTALQGNSSTGGEPISENVAQYGTLIHQYAEQYGIPAFESVIRAVMMQESGGRGSDPMQCSECPYNEKYPDGITDPEYSIEIGIKYLASCLRGAGCTSPEDTQKLSLALQGYNFGGGYINWALENYGGYSQENAAEFSKLKQEELGVSGYGDPQYVPHVLRYYTPAGKLEWPVPGFTKLTSQWGDGREHKGIDIGGAGINGQPIVAAADGTVSTAVHSGWGGGYGLCVYIDHADGLQSRYAHCSRVIVNVGDTVVKGQVIAYVGSTGDSSGPHCHFEIRRDGIPQNPMDFYN